MYKRKKEKKRIGKRNEERTCTPRLETAPPSPLFSPKARSTLSSRTEIHTSRTSRARPYKNRRERERENKSISNARAKKKKKSERETWKKISSIPSLPIRKRKRTKKKKKKYSHASVIALAEALSPLFAKSSIMFYMCSFSLSLFFLCVYFLLVLQKFFFFFSCRGVEFTKNSRITQKEKGLPNSPKTSLYKARFSSHNTHTLKKMANEKEEEIEDEVRKTHSRV
jgi:hypothetical protein